MRLQNKKKKKRRNIEKDRELAHDMTVQANIPYNNNTNKELDMTDCVDSQTLQLGLKHEAKYTRDVPRGGGEKKLHKAG